MRLKFGGTTIKEKNIQGKSLETEQLINQRGIRREREAKGEKVPPSLLPTFPVPKFH